ncbi:MAG: O-antigen ligase family protein [Nitrospinae bacterium]|nr:O-antigen ligase family protein [Nitrospinota bacterium]
MNNIRTRIAFGEKIIAFSFFLFALSCLVSISFTQIAFTMGALAWFYVVFLKNSWEDIQFPMGIAFSLFTLASILSILFSINPSKSLHFLKKLVQIFIFFMFLNNLKGPDQIRRLLYVIFIAAGLTGLYACFQSFEYGLSLSTRAEGTMSVYVTFGALMMVNALMVLSFLFFEFNLKKNWWLVPVLIVNLTGLALSLTRSTWVGFLLGLSILIFLKNKRLFMIVPVLLAVAVMAFPGQVGHRFKSIFDPTDPTRISRIDMWKMGIKVFKDYPLTGTGYYTLSEVFENYRVKAKQKKVGGLHSNFFQIITDAGILGITTWIFIWATFFFRCGLIYKSIGDSDPFFRSVVIGSISCVAAFLATGMFEGNFYDSEVIMAIYFLMSLPFVLSLKNLGFIPGTGGKRLAVAMGKNY